MLSIFSIVSSVYNWIYPVKIEQEIDDYNNYISLITKCISYNNKVVLETILQSKTFETYKKRLLESKCDKTFLIEYSSNPTVDKEIYEIISKFLN